jgi:hypothetical protein
VHRHVKLVVILNSRMLLRKTVSEGLVVESSRLMSVVMLICRRVVEHRGHVLFVLDPVLEMERMLVEGLV